MECGLEEELAAGDERVEAAEVEVVGERVQVQQHFDLVAFGEEAVRVVRLRRRHLRQTGVDAAGAGLKQSARLQRVHLRVKERLHHAHLEPHTHTHTKFSYGGSFASISYSNTSYCL